MKNLILICIVVLITIQSIYAQDEKKYDQDNVIDWNAVELSRVFGKDIFVRNGVPFMQSMVEAINATSNSRFFTSAHVPKEVDKAYFRLSLNGMLGFVREDMRWYTPSLTIEQFDPSNLGNNGLIIDFQSGKYTIDTVKLATYLFRTILHDGINAPDGDPTKINVPDKAATILGNQDAAIVINQDGNLRKIGTRRVDTINTFIRQLNVVRKLQNLDTISILSDDFTNGIFNTLDNFPPSFSLPKGGNFSTLIAGVPQLEIGSWMGTEMLIRFVPPINMGVEIGDFAFYGFGLKHSISQYFDDPTFEMAVQGVLQNTSLKNKVGLTGANLEANANIYNVNIQFSKSINSGETNILDVYAGFSYEHLSIDSKFTFTIPVEQQKQLNLLPRHDANGNLYTQSDPEFLNPKPRLPYYPGDDKPQTAELSLTNTNYKFIIGLRKEFSGFAIFADYNISQFNIFSGGLSYQF